MTTLRGPVRAVYEAGPTGFGLARAGAAAGVEMVVVAPGKTPRGAAERVKTDQRDAELLVRLLMAGSLRAIHVPSEAQEAARDLVRAREALRQDLMRSRHRVSKLLLRQGRVYPAERGTWTVAHRDWLAAQRFAQPALQLAYIDALASVDGLLARRAVLEQQLAQIAAGDEFWPVVARLRAFRGVDTLTALGLLTEIGDFQRFARPRELSSWLGLVPSISQSGQSISRGAITKTGSTHARRLLVEAAWHYTRPPRVGQTLRNRQDGQPAEVLQIAWRAQQRLYRHPHPPTQPRQARQRGHRRRRPRAGRLPLGRSDRLAAAHRALRDRRGGECGRRHARCSMGSPPRRPFLDSARRPRNQGHEVPNPRISD